MWDEPQMTNLYITYRIVNRDILAYASELPVNPEDIFPRYWY